MTYKRFIDGIPGSVVFVLKIYIYISYHLLDSHLRSLDEKIAKFQGRYRYIFNYSMFWVGRDYVGSYSSYLYKRLGN